MSIKFNTLSVPNTHKVYANGTRLGYIKANGTIVYHAQVPIKIVNNSGTTITISSSANNVNQSISSGSTFSSNFFYDSNFTLSTSELKYELTRNYNGSKTFPTWSGDSSKDIFYSTNAAYNESFNMSMDGLSLTLTKGDQITKVLKSSSCNTNGAALGLYYINNGGMSIPIYGNYTGQSLYVKSGTQLQLHASNSSNDEAYITTKSSSTYTILGNKLTSNMQRYASVTLSGSSDTVFDNWYRARYLGSILLTDSDSKSPSCTMSGDSVYITTGNSFSSASTSYTFSLRTTYKLFDFVVGYATTDIPVSQWLPYLKNITLTISKTQSNVRAYRWTSSAISLGDESTFTFTSFTAKSTGTLRFGASSATSYSVPISTTTATEYATIYNGYTSYISVSNSAPTTGFSSYSYCYRPFNSTIYLRDDTGYGSALNYSKITFNNSTKTFHNGNGLSFTVGTSSYYSISRSTASIQVRMKCPDSGSGNWTATFFNNSDISAYVYYNTKKMKSSSDYNYSLGSFSIGAGSTTTKTIYDVAWYEDIYIGANVWKYTVDTGTVTVRTITTGRQFTFHNASSSYVNLT